MSLTVAEVEPFCTRSGLVVSRGLLALTGHCRTGERFKGELRWIERTRRIKPKAYIPAQNGSVASEIMRRPGLLDEKQ